MKQVGRQAGESQPVEVTTMTMMMRVEECSNDECMGKEAKRENVTRVCKFGVCVSVHMRQSEDEKQKKDNYSHAAYEATATAEICVVKSKNETNEQTFNGTNITCCMGWGRNA